MRLKINLPNKKLVDEDIIKVIAEAENGSFCLLPNHTDFVTTLVPGLMSFTNTKGDEVFLAVDIGVLVKCGPEVLVSTHNAVIGTDLETLKETVDQEYLVKDEQEKLTYSAVSKMEAQFIRQFTKLEEHKGT